jgi:hypothetical protein
MFRAWKLDYPRMPRAGHQISQQADRVALADRYENKHYGGHHEERDEGLLKAVQKS